MNLDTQIDQLSMITNNCIQFADDAFAQYQDGILTLDEYREVFREVYKDVSMYDNKVMELEDKRLNELENARNGTEQPDGTELELPSGEQA